MATISPSPRVVVDGKFFRLGEKKFHIKGITYGPFAPLNGHDFRTEADTPRDFEIIKELGANLLRIYAVPPRWFLDLAERFELKLLVDVPWGKDFPFLDSPELQKQGEEAIRNAATECAGHPALFALSIVNEIPPDVVRWHGARNVSEYLERLVNVAKAVDPGCLCTIGNYPSTEFLRVENIDFHCFNVYLHEKRPFENYLSRLQMIADVKPLILGEFGIDSIREGEERKAEILSWKIESLYRGGLAGGIVYSFTDEWFRGGKEITDWAFGLTDRERQRKPAFESVQAQFRLAPYFPLPRYPKVSVVVACYNGGKTLTTCLNSLTRLNYSDYEVILVDDGSTDITPQIASVYKDVKYIRQPNMGLSVARNTGIAASTGEIVAFTDADCKPDPDWLYYLIGDLLREDFAGIGGHNFLPQDDSSVAAAVLVSPGGPAHVMLTDRIAEHIPGCNMAFYKWALDEIGGFDPIFTKAGDDVDVCWRIQQAGYKIGFSPSGFVWHYRRSTIGAYLKQQKGYGEAEALLARRHPEYFNVAGGSIWHGRIYGSSHFGVTLNRPIIYHGFFASGLFQTLYKAEPAAGLMLCTSLEYHVLVVGPLIILTASLPYLWPLLFAGASLPLIICVAAAGQANIPKKQLRWWSRPLVALLYLLQPIWRGWARYQGRLSVGPGPKPIGGASPFAARMPASLDAVLYWAQSGVDRLSFLKKLLDRLEKDGWQHKTDIGWSEYDVEIFGGRWANMQLTTVAEPATAAGQAIRCRMATFWSLPARVIFWGLFGLELFVIGMFKDEIAWMWMILLSLPLLIWLFEQEQKDLQRLFIQVLDVVAQDCGYERIPQQPPKLPQ